jgi:creatinine amidohydrolase
MIVQRMNAVCFPHQKTRINQRKIMPVLNKTGKKIHLADYTWDELDRLPRKKKLKFLLPLGAIEEHGYHLPLGTDAFQAGKIAELAAQKVSETIVLPTMSYGYCVDTMNFCGTIHVSARTICSLVSDIVASLYRHGFRKLVVLNFHGGNKGVVDTALREAVTRLSGPGSLFSDDFEVYQLNAFEKLEKKIKDLLEGKDYGHACEIETSVMLELASGLVDLKLAQEEYMPGGADTMWRIRDMKKASTSGVHGAPNHASLEKGKKVLEWLVEDLAGLLKQI